MLFHHRLQNLKNNIANLYSILQIRKMRHLKVTYLEPPSEPVAASGAGSALLAYRHPKKIKE